MAGAIGSTSTLALGSRTNSTVTAPASIANGDYLLAFVSAGDANDQTAPTVTGPAGFTKVTGSPFQISKADPYATGINVFWKIAASESGNYTFTHGAADSQALMYRLTGTGTSGPTVTSASGTGKTATATGLTTTTNGAVVIYGAILWDGGPGTQPAGTTPTFTERLDTGALYFADGVLATAGATGNKANATAFTAQSVISPYNAILVAVEAASSSVNGTFGVTIDPVTQSTNGDLLVQGSLAQTIAAVTQTATGQLLVKGSLAGTVDPVTLSATGKLLVQGSLAQTIAPVTQSATGQVLLNGSLAQTIAPVTLSANGSVVIQGSFGQTIDPVTLSASGGSAGAGSLNGTIDPVTLSAAGAVIIQGNFGQTIAPVTQSATGALTIKGTFGQTIDPVTLAASAGGIPDANNGALGQTIGPITLAANGSSPSQFRATSSGRGTSYAYKTLTELREEEKAKLAAMQKQASKAVAKAISGPGILTADLTEIVQDAVAATTQYQSLAPDITAFIRARIEARYRRAFKRRLEEDDDEEALLLAA